MSPLSLFAWISAVLVSGVLTWTAVTDLRTRRIPNNAILTLLLLFGPWLLQHPTPAWPNLVEAGLVSLVVGFAVFATGAIGAGDVKLFSAIALFVGLDRLLLLFTAMALAGGLLVIVTLMRRPRLALAMIQLRSRASSGVEIPYGLAIASAGLLVLWLSLLAPGYTVFGL